MINIFNIPIWNTQSLKDDQQRHKDRGWGMIEPITFDEICESQDFEHNQQFVTIEQYDDLKAKVEELSSNLRINEMKLLRTENLYNYSQKELTDLKAKYQKAVECVEWFANITLYEMDSFMTASPIHEVGEMPTNIRIDGNPILKLGLKKAQDCLAELGEKE